MIDFLRPDRVANRGTKSLIADLLLALGFGYLAVAQLQRPDVASFEPRGAMPWVLVLGPIALITVRRFAPGTVLFAATCLYLLSGLDHGEGNSLLAVPPLTYMVAATRSAKLSAALCVLSAAAISVTTTYGPGDIDAMEGGAPFVIFVFAGIGWAIGAQVRRGQLRQVELVEQAEITQEEIDAAAQQAVADERSRIARELHDAVGHAVNVMVMHAGAARLATRDEPAGKALGNIERVGRAALSDLDRMLGLLDGRVGGEAPTEPTPGLGEITRLIEGVRAAGGDVHLDNRCEGVLDSTFERPIGVAAYRIVQESLTNALKHAGPARIDVVLTCDDDEITIRVIDDGRGAVSVGTSSGGRGIVGMRERAVVHNGTLAAGPKVGGGFQVEARIPRAQEVR